MTKPTVDDADEFGTVLMHTHMGKILVPYTEVRHGELWSHTSSYSAP